MGGNIVYRNFPILIVEDQESDRALFTRWFVKAGVNAPLHFACNGEEAVDYLCGRGDFRNRREHPIPKLVLLDLRLPDMDGFEVLKWLRSQQVLGRMPVVIFTDSPRQADVNHAWEAGASGYMVKPGRAQDLLGLLGALEAFWLKKNVGPECEVASMGV